MKPLIPYFIFFIITSSIFADSSGPLIPKEGFSPNKNFRVALIPHKKCCRPSKIKVYKEDSTLIYERNAVNPIAPVSLFLSDSGYLVTFDDWGNKGFYNSIVIYNKQGKVIRNNSLEDLFSNNIIREKVRWSVSSRHWRYSGEKPKFDNNNLIITTIWGESVIINLSENTISRETQKFKRLSNLIKNLGILDSINIEYDFNHDNMRLQGSYSNGYSNFYKVNKNWEKSLISKKKIANKTLYKAFSKIESLKEYITKPTYCGNCNGEVLRIYIGNGIDINGYSIEFYKHRNLPKNKKPEFDEITKLLKF